VPITRDQLSSLTNSAAISGTTFTITFPSNPAAGSSVIAALAVNGSAVTSVMDNGTTPSTFTLDVSETGTASHVSYIYRADSITLPSSGGYVITVTCGGSGPSVSAGAQSYLGKLAGGPVSTNVATATGTSVTTNNGTPTVAGSLFAATFQNNSSGTADNPTVTNGNFTQQLSEGNGSVGQVYGFADAILAGTSAQACTWTVGTSATYSAAIAVYSPAVPLAPAPVEIAPGPVWMARAKPGMPRPHPYFPDSTALEQGPLNVTLPGPVANLSGTLVRPQDVPAIMPGPVWFALAKPGMPRPHPHPPGFEQSGEFGSLNTVLPPLSATLSGTVIRPQDVPQIAPGQTWFGRFKPGMPKPRPVTVTSPVALHSGALNLTLPPPFTSLSGQHVHSPQNLGAVLSEQTPDGLTTEATPDATFTLADYGATLVLADLGATLTGWTMQTAPLNLNEFNDVSINIAVTNNGSPYNLTGVTLNLLLKTKAGTADANALIFSSSGGSPAITVTNAASGLATALIPATDLSAETYFFYRLDVVASGLTNTCLYGPITWTTL
jgi:hypothetical protein